MATVLVTGGSGFVGAHCIVALLKAGHTVRTTIRNLSREEEVRNMLREGGVEPGENVTFFAADLNSDTGWKEAVTDCDYVLHVASPFPPGPPKHEDDLIVPAREGALRVLRAARDAGVGGARGVGFHPARRRRDGACGGEPRRHLRPGAGTGYVHLHPHRAAADEWRGAGHAQPELRPCRCARCRRSASSGDDQSRREGPALPRGGGRFCRDVRYRQDAEGAFGRCRGACADTAPARLAGAYRRRPASRKACSSSAC